MDTKQLSNDDYSRWVEMRRELKVNASKNGKTAFGWARAVLAAVDALIGRENRIEFLNDIFMRRVESSRDLSEGELFALAMWGRPTSGKETGVKGVTFCPQFHHDLSILQVVYNHQIELPGMPE